MATSNKLNKAQALESALFASSVNFADEHSHEMHYLITQRIDAARERLNLSKEEMARRIGIDRSQLSRWLGGRQNLTVDSIAKMHVALGEPVVMADDACYKTFEERGKMGRRDGSRLS